MKNKCYRINRRNYKIEPDSFQKDILVNLPTEQRLFQTTQIRGLWWSDHGIDRKGDKKWALWFSGDGVNWQQLTPYLPISVLEQTVYGEEMRGRSSWRGRSWTGKDWRKLLTVSKRRWELLQLCHALE